MNLNDLKKPFPKEKISWRVGAMSKDKTKAIALAYLDARDVMERLDEVCGPGGWQNKHPHANGKTSCAIGIKVGDEWVWKENGAGDSQVEAEKGAFSDSFKRGAVMWGIGRYLYDVPNVWVEIDEYKKFKNLNDPRLAQALASAEKGIKLADEPEPEAKPLSPAEVWAGKQKSIQKQLNALHTAAEVTQWTKDNLAKMKALEPDELNWVNDQINKAQDRVAASKAA